MSAWLALDSGKTIKKQLPIPNKTKSKLKHKILVVKGSRQIENLDNDCTRGHILYLLRTPTPFPQGNYIHWRLLYDTAEKLNT